MKKDLIRNGIIVEVRDIIGIVDKEITEHIKWNARSFCYRNDDRITFIVVAIDLL